MRNNIIGKDYAISGLRVTALLLVIWCHILEHVSMRVRWVGPIGNYFSVGVQIFLLLSGYLYGKKADVPKTPFVIRNVVKILKDYYIHYAIFIIPLCLLLKEYTVNRWFLWRVLTGARTIGNEAHLWYIPYILLCYLITPALYDIREWMSRGRYLGLKLIGLIFLIEITFITYDSYFIPAWICCYVIGYFAPKLKEYYAGLFCRKVFVVVTLVSIVANGIKYVLVYVYGYGEEYLNLAIKDCSWQAQLLKQCYHWSAILLAITISGVVYAILSHVRFRKKGKKILDICDKYSYDIYLCHMLYVKGMLSTVFLTDSLILNLLITFALIFINAVLLYYLCRPQELFALIKNNKRMKSEGKSG
ncbi:MAG: acyltransferase [Blautia sp.]|nr:acyltransferase [Blautia sp.]